MVEVQERVARLEGRVEGHERMLTDVVATVRHLEAKMEQRFIGVDLRFTVLESRLTTIEGRITGLDQKVGNLDRKLETGYLWIVGIQFATLIAIVAAFIAL
jgi:uncharacterized coiled-coil protein SlyX